MTTIYASRSFHISPLPSACGSTNHHAAADPPHDREPANPKRFVRTARFGQEDRHRARSSQARDEHLRKDEPDRHPSTAQKANVMTSAARRNHKRFLILALAMTLYSHRLRWPSPIPFSFAHSPLMTMISGAATRAPCEVGRRGQPGGNRHERTDRHTAQ